MPFPTDSGTIPTSMQGGTLLADATDDHALHHRNIGTVINALPTVFGTTPGTNLFKSYVAGWFPLAVIYNGAGHGSLQAVVDAGTINNAVFGSMTATGGTIAGQIQNNGTVANGVYGTAQWTGGTLSPSVVSGSVIGSANILDGNVPERKIRMDQLSGTTLTSGTTASQTKVDIVGGSININLNVASNVMIHFSAAVSNSGVVPTFFTLLTDGAADSVWNDIAFINSASPGAAAFTAWRTGLAAGTHSWKMQWRTSGVGTLTLAAFEFIVQPFSQ